MNPILLNGSGHVVDVDVQKGKQRHFVLLCGHGVGVVEVANVVLAVIGRQCDSGKCDLDSSGLQCGDDLIKIRASRRDRQATQSVIATEFHNSNSRMRGQHVFQTGYSVFCGITAYALVDDAVVIAARVQQLLQVIWICMPRIGAETGSQAIAEAYDNRVVSGGSAGRTETGQQQKRQDKKRYRPEELHRKIVA